MACGTVLHGIASSVQVLRSLWWHRKMFCSVMMDVTAAKPAARVCKVGAAVTGVALDASPPVLTTAIAIIAPGVAQHHVYMMCVLCVMLRRLQLPVTAGACCCVVCGWRGEDAPNAIASGRINGAAPLSSLPSSRQAMQGVYILLEYQIIALTPPEERLLSHFQSWTHFS
jgi:hypothetical protein